MKPSLRKFSLDSSLKFASLSTSSFNLIEMKKRKRRRKKIDSIILGKESVINALKLNNVVRDISEAAASIQ